MKLTLPIIAVLLLAGAYCLGYSDGKLSQQETYLLAKLDELIRRIRP